MQSLACNQATHLELQCRLSASLHRLSLRLDCSVTLQPPVDLVRFSLMHEELQMLHSKLPTGLQRGLQTPQWLVSYRTLCRPLPTPFADPF